MTDPRRLLDESRDELERALLRSVRSDAMPDGSRRRILAGVGLGGAVVATTSTAASSLIAGKTLLFKGTSQVLFKWIAVSALAGLVPAGAWVARSSTQREVVASAVRSAPIDEPKATTPSESTTARAPAPESPPAPAKPVVREPKAPVQVVAAAPSLSDEVAALQVARNALADHDASAALAALDRYKSRFGAGRLAPEATVLRIQALVERGDRAQAMALADRFESANPKSPYADRIRSILGTAKGAAQVTQISARSAKDPGAR